MAYLVAQDQPVNLLDAVRYRHNREAIAAEYVALIGYDPFADMPDLTNDEAAAVLREWRAERAAQSGQ